MGYSERTMRAKFLYLTLLPLVFAISANGVEDYRKFTSADGKVLEAKMIKVVGADVVIQAKNGRSYTLPAAKFSPEDQSYFKKFAEDQAKNYEPRLEIKFSSKKGDRRTDVYYDDRTQGLEPTVRIENREQEFEVKGATVTVVTIAKHVTNRNELKVISREDFKLPSLPAGKTATLTGKSIKLEYDDQNSYRYGHKYSGYVVVVKNAVGKITNTAGTTGYINRAEQALKLKKDQIMDRDFKVWESGS